MNNLSKSIGLVQLVDIANRFARAHSFSLNTMFATMPAPTFNENGERADWPIGFSRENIMKDGHYGQFECEITRRAIEPIELIISTSIDELIQELEVQVKKLSRYHSFTGFEDHAIEMAHKSEVEDVERIISMIQKCNVVDFKDSESNFLKKGALSMASDIVYSTLCHTTDKKWKEKSGILKKSFEMLTRRMHEEDHAHLFVEGCVKYLFDKEAVSPYNFDVCLECIMTALRARRRFVEIFDSVGLEFEDSPYSISSTDYFRDRVNTAYEIQRIDHIIRVVELNTWPEDFS